MKILKIISICLLGFCLLSIVLLLMNEYILIENDFLGLPLAVNMFVAPILSIITFGIDLCRKENKYDK